MAKGDEDTAGHSGYQDRIISFRCSFPESHSTEAKTKSFFTFEISLFTNLTSKCIFLQQYHITKTRNLSHCFPS